MTKTITKPKENNKAEYINKLFNQIAYKYDLLNNLMTFGQHYKWKEETINLALSENNTPRNALDICSGTGDLGIILNKKSPNTKIICLDNSENMLAITKEKIKNLHLSNISLRSCNFETINSNFETFDLITIGFGLRNLIHKEKSIETIFTLLSNNGVFACIDLGYPENSLWRKIYFSYFFKMVPNLGAIFAKNKDAYTYLPDSLSTWFKQDELKTILLNKGFRRCYYKNILGGIVSIHIAVK